MPEGQFSVVLARRRMRAGFARRAGGAGALAPRRQHGAAAVMAAIFLSLALAALGALDVGNVYYARRQLQRTADLAAMAGVQVISSPTGCSTVTTVAQQNATANGFTADGSTKTLTTTCGRWDTSSSTYFGTSGNPLNAVQVKVTQQVPFLFLGPQRTVTATATALASNIDAFSLGTGIATINTQQSALLNAILGGLLKTSVSLSIGDTQSLAAAHIKLSDLMVALSASSMQGLLSTTVTYQNLMVAMANALVAGGDTVNAAILRTLAVAVPGGQNITIGDSGPTAPGLLALGLANPNAAATATINAFDALMVAAQIAQRSPDGSVSKAPVINVTAGLTGVASISLQIIHPPVLAVGEGGTVGTGANAVPRTQARTAVVDLAVSLLPGFPAFSVGIPGLSVNIAALNTPLVLSATVGQGFANLTSVDCESTKAATNAVIQVTPSVAAICLGANSTCGGTINVASISAVILGINVPVASVALNGIGPLTIGPGAQTLPPFNGSTGSFDTSQTVNSNQLGTGLGTFSSQLLTALAKPNALQVGVATIDLSQLIQPIVSTLATALATALTPILSSLDTILVPTLSLLGAQVGTATVHNMSLTCGVAQLVN